MYSDFNAKWTPIQQMTKGVPISVSIFGNYAIDGRETSVWEADRYYHSSDEYPCSNYKFRFSDRTSYFVALNIARKFCDVLTLQGGVSLSHFSVVPWHQDHDKVGLHVGRRIKVTPQGSIIFNGDYQTLGILIFENPSV